ESDRAGPGVSRDHGSARTDPGGTGPAAGGGSAFDRESFAAFGSDRIGAESGSGREVELGACKDPGWDFRSGAPDGAGGADRRAGSVGAELGADGERRGRAGGIRSPGTGSVGAYSGPGADDHFATGFAGSTPHDRRQEEG